MIEAVNLKKAYPVAEQAYIALKGINLKVNEGEFLAIMGPSGSGKSTLLHLLGGLDRPSEGKLMIDGTEISCLSEKECTLFRRRKIGFIFQNYQLLPTMSVEENIAFPAAADRLPKEEIAKRVSTLIREVGLLGKERAIPSQLSGGQQQRVSIARSLVINPKLVLADEPTGNLDRKRGKEILELLARLHRDEGLTIVMVTHDLFAASFADRVLLLKDGMIEADVNQRDEVGDHVLANFLAKLNA